MLFSKSSLNFNILQYHEGVRPPVPKPNPQFLDELGEVGIRSLLDRFYMLLQTSTIKHIFPQGTEAMKIAGQNSADFFIQICGGTSYFTQNRGVPKMVKRHSPFQITPEARLQWLILFKEALNPLIGEISDQNLQSFWNYINTFSIWMINTK